MPEKCFIAVSSQNFKTVTAHAGKARRFLIYSVDGKGDVKEDTRLDLPMGMAMREFNDEKNHPLDDMTFLITGGARVRFVERMAKRGVRVLTTEETDPESAVQALLTNQLRVPLINPDSKNHLTT